MESLFDPASREQDLIQLAALVFAPAAAALLLQLVPGRFRELVRWLGLFAAGGVLALSLCVLVDYHRLLDSYSDRSTRSLDHPATRLEARSDRQLFDAARAVPRAFNSLDLLTRRPWVERFDASFALAADGVGLALVLTVALVTLLAVAASATVGRNLRGFVSLLLLFESLLVGALLSADLLLFVAFSEAATVPAFLLVGVWGSKAAAQRLAVCQIAAGACVAAAAAGLHAVDVRDFVPQPADGPADRAVHTFDPVTLGKAGRAVALLLTGQEARLECRLASDPAEAEPRPAADGAVRLFAPCVDRAAAVERLKGEWVCSRGAQFALFGLLAAAFLLKLGVPPLHSWLTGAVGVSPVAAGMALLAGAGVGGYGLYRFAAPLAPWAAGEAAPVAAALGALAALAGAVCAWRMCDLSRVAGSLVAASAGFAVAGLFAGGDADARAAGACGAVLLLMGRGVIGAALLYAADALAGRFAGREPGGVLAASPALGALASVPFAALAFAPGLLPGYGLFLTTQGLFAASPAVGALAVVAAAVTALAVVRLWMRTFLGAAPDAFAPVTAREFTLLGVAALVALGLGVMPGFVGLQWIEPGVSGWADSLARLRP